MNELFKDDIVKDFRRENYILNKEDFKYIFDNRTHSKLTMGNISVFFNEIVQQIKASKILFDVKIDIIKVKSNNIKVTEFEYNGKVSISTDLSDIIGYFPKDLGNHSSKDNASKMCHFYVLNVLKNCHYLDQHFKFVKKIN